MSEIPIDAILAIVIPILGVVTTIFGTKMQGFKAKITQMKALISSIDSALDDNKLSELEAKIIVKNLRALINS